MLLLPAYKFNEKLYSGRWTNDVDTPLFVSVSGYPMTVESKEAGFPLKEMGQVLF